MLGPLTQKLSTLMLRVHKQKLQVCEQQSLRKKRCLYTDLVMVKEACVNEVTT